MEVIEWNLALEKCKYDKDVGIKIAKLSGDVKFSTYLTTIDPGKYVNPHYHKRGDEHYHILEGAGEITITDMVSKASTTIQVAQNSTFTVPANKAHQLINTGHIPLVLMFSCPESHLGTDRYLLD